MKIELRKRSNGYSASLIHEHITNTYFFRTVEELMIAIARDVTLYMSDCTKLEETISDGFGSSWSAYCPTCGRKSMHIIRPGKVQCAHCS